MNTIPVTPTNYQPSMNIQNTAQPLQVKHTQPTQTVQAVKPTESSERSGSRGTKLDTYA